MYHNERNKNKLKGGDIYMRSISKFSINKFDILMFVLGICAIITHSPECFISIIIVWCAADIRKILIKILEKNTNL